MFYQWNIEKELQYSTCKEQEPENKPICFSWPASSCLWCKLCFNNTLFHFLGRPESNQSASAFFTVVSSLVHSEWGWSELEVSALPRASREILRNASPSVWCAVGSWWGSRLQGACPSRYPWLFLRSGVYCVSLRSVGTSCGHLDHTHPFVVVWQVGQQVTSCKCSNKTPNITTKRLLLTLV